MTSKVSICNLALSNVAAGNITSLTEESAEARACNQFYDQTLASLLESYHWRFARRAVALAEVTNTKPGKWRKAFRRPSDCRKLRRITDALMLDDTDAKGVANEQEGSVIFCNLDVAYLEYTADQPDPTKFPALFVDALSWLLAVKLAMPLTRDPKVRADAYQVAQRSRSDAEIADANEHRETTDYEPNTMGARK